MVGANEILAIGDLVNFVRGDPHPDVTTLRMQHGSGPHKVIAVGDECARLEFLNCPGKNPVMAFEFLVKVGGGSDPTIPKGKAYRMNKSLAWCCRCGLRTTWIGIGGGGFQYCPCIEPDWENPVTG